MKLLFSESCPDYSNYQFPYVIWAFPDLDEPRYKLYELGFMPSKGTPPRFYLSRSTRVNLAKFSLSSENRRILRKHDDMTLEIIPREEFILSESIVKMSLRCASERFGPGTMTESRLRDLFDSMYTTHLFCFKKNGALVGIVTALFEPPHFVHYNFAFYDIDSNLPSLGMFMMTSFLIEMSSKNIQYAYLGTCYSHRTLYKTQFKGCEFFSGVRWSDDLKELKYLIDRQEKLNVKNEHLLESVEYLERFFSDNVNQLVEKSKINIPCINHFDPLI